jgi:hypothetical protein
MVNDTPVRFDLGRVLATPGVTARASHTEIIAALARHAAGDWGEVNDDDKRANEEALRVGARLLSAYATVAGTKFWIITEADRQSTTILLPEEY